MTNYRRYRIKGGTYFFTVNLVERKRTLLTEHISALREAFRSVKQAHPFQIDAIVILPDHLHALWTLPEGDDDFSLRWRQIKSAFSRQIEKEERISKSRTTKNERGLWQRRLLWQAQYKFGNMLSGMTAIFLKHVDYIYLNSVKQIY